MTILLTVSPTDAVALLNGNLASLIRRILAVVNEIIACNEQNVATPQGEKK